MVHQPHLPFFLSTNRLPLGIWTEKKSTCKVWVLTGNDQRMIMTDIMLVIMGYKDQIQFLYMINMLHID
jgi:hypothetical protein